MYGYSWLCDRLRSSAIMWKQISLRWSPTCDLRSAMVCDHMVTSLKGMLELCVFRKKDNELRVPNFFYARREFGIYLNFFFFVKDMSSICKLESRP